MKHFIILLLVSLSISVLGQSVISSINASAVSNDDMVFTVGEIYVIPTDNLDNANSGVLGALSIIEFLTTGVDNALASEYLRVFPNPTANSIRFKTIGTDAFKRIFIYDSKGSLVLQTEYVSSSVDLTNLVAGVYTVITDNKSIDSFKIIKQ